MNRFKRSIDFGSMVVLTSNVVLCYVAWSGLAKLLKGFVESLDQLELAFFMSEMPAHTLNVALSPVWALILGLFLILCDIAIGTGRFRFQLATLCVLQWAPLAYMLALFL